MDAFLGLDLGTSALKSIVVDEHGAVLFRDTRAYGSSSPASGRFEQDPADWEAALAAALAAMPADVRSRISAIGTCGQVPTLVLVDSAGHPVGPALTWQDSRAEAEAHQLGDRIGSTWDELGTELPWSASQLPAKLAWIRRSSPQVADRARWAMQPKDYLNLLLTGEAGTDPWSSKGLCDVRTGAPAARILAAAGWGPEICPPARAPWQSAGSVSPHAASAYGLTQGIPVAAGWSDALAAVLAVGAFEESSGFVLTGTSDIIGVSSEAPDAAPGLYRVPASVAPRPLTYGPTQSSGASVNWVAELLGIPVSEALELAAGAGEGESGAGSGAAATGTVPTFVPYLSGERAPLWDPAVRGTFLGLSADSGRGEVVRSVLLGVALSGRHVLETTYAATGARAAAVHVGGRGIDLPVWRGLRRSALGVPLRLHTEPNLSALGAAMLAAMLRGARLEDLASLRTPPVEVDPTDREIESGNADYRRYLAASRVAQDWNAQEPNAHDPDAHDGNPQERSAT